MAFFLSSDTRQAQFSNCYHIRPSPIQHAILIGWLDVLASPRFRTRFGHFHGPAVALIWGSFPWSLVKVESFETQTFGT